MQWEIGKLANFLDGFKGIDRNSWDHSTAFANAPLPEYGYCVGHRAAEVLGCEPKRDAGIPPSGSAIVYCSAEDTVTITLPTHAPKLGFYHFTQGILAMCELLNMYKDVDPDSDLCTIVEDIMVRLIGLLDYFAGANDPYYVLCDAVKAHTGYDHIAATAERELAEMIPDDLFEEPEGTLDKIAELVLA